MHFQYTVLVILENNRIFSWFIRIAQLTWLCMRRLWSPFHCYLLWFSYIFNEFAVCFCVLPTCEGSYNFNLPNFILSEGFQNHMGKAHKLRMFLMRQLSFVCTCNDSPIFLISLNSSSFAKLILLSMCCKQRQITNH